jgi:O-methyltransferase
MQRIVKFCKDFLLFFPLNWILRPFTRSLLFIAYFNRLTVWIRRHKDSFAFSDFYTPVRDYNKRYDLYAYVADRFADSDTPVVYLEFGVAEGASFRWWQQRNANPASRFFGFDTFEGLPEAWGSFYNKGDMKFAMPAMHDDRGRFLKGLFQDTLPGFIREEKALLESDHRKIILLDADLYSATIFTLSQLYPLLHKGDIIMFDEFNVPMHEFKAFTEFTGNFYVKLLPVGAVNNFYQVAFEVA